MTRQLIRALIAVEVARGFFMAGEHDKGITAYAEATRIVDQELKRPDEFLLAFTRCEGILREFIWTVGDADVG